MKIISVTPEEEAVVAKLRREALKAKAGAESAEVVRANTAGLSIVEPDKADWWKVSADATVTAAGTSEGASWKESVKAGEVVHCSESIPLVW